MLHRRAVFRPRLSATFVVAATARRWLATDRLEDTYQQEAYEALVRHNASTTYPGTIKAATPGDTRCYFEGPEDYDHRPDARHYWRPVVDDAAVRDLVAVRVRFKENVFVAPSWETRMHVVLVSLSPDATVDDVVNEVARTNVHVSVGRLPYTVAYKGKQLEGSTPLVDLVPNGISFLDRGLTLDAIETATDHMWHQEATRPTDWNRTDVSAAAERAPPLADVKPLALHADQNQAEAEIKTVPTKPPVDFGHMR